GSITSKCSGPGTTRMAWMANAIAVKPPPTTAKRRGSSRAAPDDAPLGPLCTMATVPGHARHSRRRVPALKNLISVVNTWLGAGERSETDGRQEQFGEARLCSSDQEIDIMGRAVYVVVGREGEWSVEHDGKLSGPYVSKEAAFEAAVGPASLSIHDGDNVVIE